MEKQSAEYIRFLRYRSAQCRLLEDNNLFTEKDNPNFIYCELMKYNEAFMDKIQAAKDSKALLEIWEQMKAKSFLNYNVDIKKQEEHIEEFKALSLKEQKQHLCEILDKNQLYVNLSSLNDKDFDVSEEDKKLNCLFYGE